MTVEGLTLSDTRPISKVPVYLSVFLSMVVSDCLYPHLHSIGVLVICQNVQQLFITEKIEPGKHQPFGLQVILYNNNNNNNESIKLY